MAICNQCGSQQPDGASFCSICGAPLTNAPQPKSSSLSDGWVDDPQTTQPLPKPEPYRQPEPYQPPVQPYQQPQAPQYQQPYQQPPQYQQPYQQPQYFQQAPPAQPYSPVPPTPPAAPKPPKNNRQQKKARGGFVKIFLVVILLGAGYFGYDWLKKSGILDPGKDPLPREQVSPGGTDSFEGALPDGTDNSDALGNILRDFLLGDNALMGDGFESLDDGSDGFQSLEEDMTLEERASYLEALMGRSQAELTSELAKGDAGDKAKIKELRDFLQVAKEELKKLKQ